MMERLDAHLQGLLAAAGPGERRKLARDIATDLRARQQRRIAAQLNPDGTPYAPKKPRLRAGKGRIRRALFSRIRTARYLRIESSAEAAVITVAGRAARIARVHQYGLTDRVAPKGPEYRYPARRILGLAESDRAAIADRVIDHLARA